MIRPRSASPKRTGARVLVVSKTTSYQTYVKERRDRRTTELLAKKDPTVERVLASHEAHEDALREVRRVVRELGLTAGFVTTETLHDCAPGEFDLVVTVGGDGTLLATSRSVGVTTPILGINSAPGHSVGFFCGAQKGGVKRAFEAVLADVMPRTVVSRMQVDLNGLCLSRRVLNDALLCHEVPAATSRYILIVQPGDGGDDATEEQKSSGLWIGPAAGSTAAQRSAGGHVLPLTSRRIQYVVREPYTPMGKPLSLSRGTVSEGGVITIRSKMRQGKLFLDGPHVVHEVGLGDVVVLRRSDEDLTVLGLSRTKTAGRKPAVRRR